MDHEEDSRPPPSFADVDHVRQALVDDYGAQLVPFLLPAVRARAAETEREGFVPTHPDIAWILKYPGFRVIAAFNQGENEQARIREEIEAGSLDDGVWSLPHGERKTVQKVFDGLCYSIALAIGVAWTEAIYYEMERVQGDEGRHSLLPSDIDDDMLPVCGEVFQTVIAAGEIDVQVALAILRESKKDLPEGERLPKALADHFLADFN